MAALIEAIEIKRKSYFEFENAPYHCLDVEISTPTARGGQTLVRLKMRNLITRAVFDKTFKAGDKFAEPDLVMAKASYTYSDGDGYHFLDQDTYETLTLTRDALGEDSGLLTDNLEVQIHRYNGQPIGILFPPHVELTVTNTEMGVRGNTASGSVTKTAVLETGLEVQVMMPVVNAPFRIYWAYNPWIVQENIQGPVVADRSFFPNQASYINALNQVGNIIGYRERRTLFRFSVGRTF